MCSAAERFSRLAHIGVRSSPQPIAESCCGVGIDLIEKLKQPLMRNRVELGGEDAETIYSAHMPVGGGSRQWLRARARREWTPDQPQPPRTAQRRRREPRISQRDRKH